MTSPKEFVEFHKLLMSNAPEGFVPWYFPVKRDGKDPDGFAINARAPEGSTEPYSWKAAHAKLSAIEALNRLKEGSNVGISARSNDPLVLIDIDAHEFLGSMPITLVIRSRKRNGLHGYCWAGDKLVKTNIPTDQGEMRCNDQYVLAAGCSVPVTDKDLDNWVKEKELTPELAERVRNDPNRGVYTVEDAFAPITITFKGLPKFFKEQWLRNREAEKRAKELKRNTINPSGPHSALFDLKMSDIVPTLPGRREPHPLHPSDTGANFSISIDGGLCHCWRHLVSLNAIQFLCVKAKYASCQEAGTPHGGGASHILGDSGGIFYAWREAKKMKLIPLGDPIPVKALWWVAKQKGFVKEIKANKPLPRGAYNKTLEVDLDGF